MRCPPFLWRTDSVCLLLFLFAITAGVSIFAAQYWGIQDRDSVEKTLGIGLAASVLISLPFTIGALFFPEQLMRIFASDPVLIEDGAAYLRVVGISYFLLSISQIYLRCILKTADTPWRVPSSVPFL